MQEVRVCRSIWCGYSTSEPHARCLRCGKSLLTTRQVRALGVVLVLLGGFLTALMAGIIVLVAALVHQSGRPGSGVRFDGNEVTLIAIFGVLGLVLALGLSFMAAGAWQIIAGRRSKMIVWVILALVAATLFVGGMLRALA